MATLSHLHQTMSCPRPEKPSRLSVEPVFSPVASPKRKRDYDSDSDETSRESGIIRIRTALPSRPKVEEEPFSPTSPRTKVSRQLHDLKLNKPDLTFTSAVSAFGQAEQAPDSSGSWKLSSPPSEISPDTSLHVKTEQLPGHVLPVTPTLKPQAEVERIPLSPMPLPSPLPDSSYRPNYRVHTPPPESLAYQNPSSPSSGKELWSPGAVSNGELDDSVDDGLGINGIGFKPTPAMAYARSQRRKQQVAEWKTREAKEARQRRMDRRRKILVGSETQSPTARRVRFVDG